MRFVERVVFDTSTLVSAALRVDSTPATALRAALSGCEVCASEETLRELEDVLMRAKFDRYLERAERQAFFDLFARHSVLYEVRASVAACRDPKDDKFLALALACGARVLVTSDRDLLELDPFQDVAIRTPAAFVASA